MKGIFIFGDIHPVRSEEYEIQTFPPIPNESISSYPLRPDLSAALPYPAAYLNTSFLPAQLT